MSVKIRAAMQKFLPVAASLLVEAIGTIASGAVRQYLRRDRGELLYSPQFPPLPDLADLDGLMREETDQ